MVAHGGCPDRSAGTALADRQGAAAMCAESGDLDHDHERDRTSLTRQISVRKPHGLAAMTTAMIPSGTTAPGKGSLTVAKPIGIVTPAWTRGGEGAAPIDQRADVRQRLQQRPRGRGGGRGGVVAVGALIGDPEGRGAGWRPDDGEAHDVLPCDSVHRKSWPPTAPASLRRAVTATSPAHGPAD